MTHLAIQTIELAKQFVTSDGQTVDAVRGIELGIEPGEIYALLGPNGAGKTTVLSMLTTLLLPTAGHAIVAGYDVVQEPAQVRRRIGVTFQEIVIDEDLTGRQILDYHGQLYGQNKALRRDRIAELASLVELCNVLDRKAAGYSGGMKRRLELARGLLTNPSILFLDEPTQGLDPTNRASIWSYIHRLRNETGLTLLLTTHYMEEAEALADRVGIIDNGRLVVQGSPGDLVREMGDDVVSIEGTGVLDQLLKGIQAETYVSHLKHFASGEGKFELQIGVDNGDRRLVHLLGLAAEFDVHVSAVSVSRPSLADVFLAHTGHSLRDA
jgi:ABC-2 type transport system ATP-binding protein